MDIDLAVVVSQYDALEAYFVQFLVDEHRLDDDDDELVYTGCSLALADDEVRAHLVAAADVGVDVARRWLREIAADELHAILTTFYPLVAASEAPEFPRATIALATRLIRAGTPLVEGTRDGWRYRFLLVRVLMVFNKLKGAPLFDVMDNVLVARAMISQASVVGLFAHAYWIRRRGQDFRAMLAAQTLLDDNGNPLDLSCSMRDVIHVRQMLDVRADDGSYIWPDDPPDFIAHMQESTRWLNRWYPSMRIARVPQARLRAEDLFPAVYLLHATEDNERDPQ
jgi:hypothetical protein